jgi:hypothetical protein
MYSPLLQAFAFNNSSTGRALRTGWLFLVVALALPAFSLTALAVTPPPDGGYPNQNTAEGDSALFSLTTGDSNTANGFQALFNNTNGGGNTATGFEALFSNTTGGQNTANGADALFSNTIGHDNTAAGVNALFSNTNGIGNTATGSAALIFNTTGGSNTATGTAALFSNTIGSENTATGAAALAFNTTGHDNTANGFDALISNSTGSRNTADGVSALSQSTTGNNNTATGANALFSCNTGNNNTGGGFRALFNNVAGSNNTAEGFGALANSTGSNNTALGSNAGINLRTGENNVYIDAQGVSVESETIRIGRRGVQKAAYVQGISGATVPAGVTVIIGSNGHLGTVQSSARYKDEIKPMDKASEAIFVLNPVTFRYKQELDPDGIPQFGLVAEEVERVNPDLVVRDEDGKVETVRYEAVNAMLLNEFLKEHQRAVEDHQKVEEQGTMIARQQKQIEALTATVRKVSDQIQMSKPAPQLAASTH